MGIGLKQKSLRLSVEEKLAESAEKHWKEIEGLKQNLWFLHKTVSQCVKQDKHISLEKRTQFLEKELSDKHETRSTGSTTTLGDYIDSANEEIGDSAEKYSTKEFMAKHSRRI